MQKEEEIITGKFLYFNKREIVWIILMIIIFEFIITLTVDDNENLVINIRTPLVFLVPPLIILTNVISKKIASWYYDIRIELDVLKFYRWSYYSRSHFKKPFPLGLVFPFFMSFFTMGYVKPLTFFQFDYKNIPERRMLKHQGRIRKTEINEGDPAFVIAWGGYALLVLSAIGMMFGFEELAKYPVYYVLWNLVPFGGTDGMKMFFGSIMNWAVLLFVSIICLGITAIMVF